MDAYAALYGAMGHLIRARRKDTDLTQEELAERIGLTRTSINNIEQGKQRIQIHTLYAIAQALSVSPLTFLPPPEAGSPREMGAILPSDLAPPEREWVKTVLAEPSDHPEQYNLIQK